jgi:hypothetical protein
MGRRPVLAALGSAESAILTRVKSFLASATFIALLSSCGSSNGGGGSELSRSTTIASLTPAQAGTLCDWLAARSGGYGRTESCPDGSTQATPPNHGACVDDLPYPGAVCPTLTVGDVEDCANTIGSALCNLTDAPACSKYAACLGL